LANISKSAPKVALVTGASRGIGRAIAIALAQVGHDVACSARSAADLRETAERITSAGRRALLIPGDLTDPGQPKRVVSETISRLGRLDVLVNNAGGGPDADPPQDPATVWDSVLNLNLRVPYLLCEEAGVHFKRRGTGIIINITSILSVIATRPSSVAYVVAKHGLLGLTRALAVQWAQAGIRVNAVAPGYIRTAMSESYVADPALSSWVVERTPLGRWGEPTDIVGAVQFLASDAARFITGQTIIVDGGWTAS
jgi:2-deoxy-D-gluconate 3-dehydrogenase